MSIDLSQLYSQAQSAADVAGDDSGGARWTPPEGLELSVVVVKANGDDQGTKAGFPKWGFWLEVTDGEYAGKRFWDNVYLSGHDGANKRSFAKLAAAGFDQAWWASGPGAKATAEAAIGREFVVVTSYQELKDGQAEPFSQHKWKPKSGPVFSVPAESDDDESPWH